MRSHRLKDLLRGQQATVTGGCSHMRNKVIHVGVVWGVDAYPDS